jgi:hypothetical protein
MLGFMDTFASIANPPEDAFVLFDNVRVEDLSNPIRFLSSSNLPGGGFRMLTSAVLGQSCFLDASANLFDWENVAVVTPTNAPLMFLDPLPPNEDHRFYRFRQ